MMTIIGALHLSGQKDHSVLAPTATTTPTGAPGTSTRPTTTSTASMSLA